MIRSKPQHISRLVLTLQEKISSNSALFALPHHHHLLLLLLPLVFLFDVSLSVEVLLVASSPIAPQNARLSRAVQEILTSRPTLRLQHAQHRADRQSQSRRDHRRGITGRCGLPSLSLFFARRDMDCRRQQIVSVHRYRVRGVRLNY